MITDYVYKWLDNALDVGISEFDFWNMTLIELERAFKSAKRKQETEMKLRASMDYRLADLIGRSVSRVYNSNNKMPDITEAYPGLFDNQKIEETKQEKKMKLSAIRFKQFADAFNYKYAKGGKT